jgi:hypothetical protein
MEGESVEKDDGMAPLFQFRLEAQLHQQNLPRHLALFYESTSMQLDSVAAFLKYGLTTNYKCLYLADVNSPQQIKNVLQTASIDVPHGINTGDLVIRDASEVYLESGFDPNQMIRTLKEACAESEEAGYDGLCVVGENSWCFHTEMEFDAILDFEVEFDATCPDLPVIALCQYGLSHFSEESASKALWAHEKSLITR